MCYMIVVALPPEAQQRWIAGLPEGLHSWQRAYAGMPARMKQWQPVVVGTSQCSCDLFCPRTDEKIRRLRRKYEKQGWSEAKIGRALAEKVPTGFPGSLHPELRRWLALAVQEAGEAFLMVHWDYAALPHDAEVRLSLAEFEVPDCEIMEEHLYHICPRG